MNSDKLIIDLCRRKRQSVCKRDYQKSPLRQKSKIENLELPD